jgi:hypothetical protein
MCLARLSFSVTNTHATIRSLTAVGVLEIRHICTYMLDFRSPDV